MEDLTTSLKDISRSWGDVAKMVSSVIVGGVALIGVIKTTLIPYFSASGPAVQLHEMKVVPSRPGFDGFVELKLSQLRPCKPSTIAFEITDSVGRTFPINLNWTRALAMKKNQAVTFDFVMPKSIAGGHAQSYLSATHANCDDGGRAPPPQDISVKATIFVQ